MARGGANGCAMPPKNQQAFHTAQTSRLLVSRAARMHVHVCVCVCVGGGESGRQATVTDGRRGEEGGGGEYTSQGRRPGIGTRHAVPIALDALAAAPPVRLAAARASGRSNGDGGGVHWPARGCPSADGPRPAVCSTATRWRCGSPNPCPSHTTPRRSQRAGESGGSVGGERSCGKLASASWPYPSFSPPSLQWLAFPYFQPPAPACLGAAHFRRCCC